LDNAQQQESNIPNRPGIGRKKKEPRGNREGEKVIGERPVRGGNVPILTSMGTRHFKGGS